MTIKTRFTFIDLDNETHGEKRVVLGWTSTPENESLARELFVADEVEITFTPKSTTLTPMTHPEKLEAIRQKCIEANPTRWDEYRTPDPDLPPTNWSTAIIRLADVLLAIDQKGEWLEVNPKGELYHKLKTEVVYWNLREDDLAKQSPDTIDFLADLLTPKGEPSKEN